MSLEDEDKSIGSDFSLWIYNPIFQLPKRTKSKSNFFFLDKYKRITNYKRITKHSTILSNKLHACTQKFW